jgi:hypothetical protein
VASWVPWAAAFTVISSTLLVLPERRALLLAGLLLQYAAVSGLTAYSLGFRAALVMLIGGGLAAAILWLSITPTRDEAERAGTSLVDRWSFRVVALMLVLAVGWGGGRADWIQVEGLLPVARLAATILLAVGLLQVGVFERSLRVGLGLLTLVSGFQVIYAAIEPSLAVVALLTLVHLGLSLTIGFLGQQVATRTSGRMNQP